MLIGIDASRATLAHRTGTETYSLHLIRHLAGLAPSRGHRLRLYVREMPPDGWLPSGPDAEMRVIRRARLWTHLGLGPEIRRRPPDVLFVPAHVIPLRCVVPSVVTLHDLGFRHYPGAHPLVARLYLDWSTGHSAREARRVIVDSQATADDLQRLYPIPETKSRVVYPGVDPALAPVRAPDRLAAVQSRYDLPHPYILHVGSLHPRKNLARLVQAFAQVREQYREPLDLVLAGLRGWRYESLLSEVARLGLENHVRFPGYVADEDMAALYSGARVLAFPSLYEGFGFPVLEAMACETPVVCSDTSSLPELVGEGAITFPPTDVEAMATALLRVLTDESLRQTLIARGRERASRFTWESCARETLAVLEEAASREP
jgi:glycosyltransferase involved in cell wall biosynthesis